LARNPLLDSGSLGNICAYLGLGELLKLVVGSRHAPIDFSVTIVTQVDQFLPRCLSFVVMVFILEWISGRGQEVVPPCRPARSCIDPAHDPLNTLIAALSPNTHI
jgi:hypothetical protein